MVISFLFSPSISSMPSALALSLSLMIISAKSLDMYVMEFPFVLRPLTVPLNARLLASDSLGCVLLFRNAGDEAIQMWLDFLSILMTGV